MSFLDLRNSLINIKSEDPSKKDQVHSDYSNNYDQIETIDSNSIKFEEIYNSSINRKERDKCTTSLYTEYINNFKSINSFRKVYKKIIFWFCIALLLCLTIALIVGIKYILKSNLSMEIILSALIPSCVTYITSIIGILEIIAKHLFPTDEEKYINEIVETIIHEDLEGKKLDRQDKYDNLT